MENKEFPVIDMDATGKNITNLRKARGLTVKDLQVWFGFEEPQAIYKWQHGKSLPSVDNLYALGVLLEVPIENILVPVGTVRHTKSGGSESAALPFYLSESLSALGAELKILLCGISAGRTSANP